LARRRRGVAALRRDYRSHRTAADLDRVGQQRSRLADAARGSSRRRADSCRSSADGGGMSAPVTAPPFEPPFAAALLDPGLPVPHGVVADNAPSENRRFAVHGNNVVAGLVEALEARFPAAEKIVGQEFFVAMARAFIQKRPPRSLWLATYGDEFAEFIGAFEPAHELPYLAHVARIEAARTRAYHAADAAPLGVSELAQLDAKALSG